MKESAPAKPATDNLLEHLEESGASRRKFMKFCATVAALMGLPPTLASAKDVAKTLTAKKKPSVVYLHCAECTGCSEAILRTVDPYIDTLLLDIISMDYHETIMAAAGEAAEDALHKAVSNPNGFILVVEGGLPKEDFGKVGNVPMIKMVRDIAPKAKAVLTMGNCANYGGVQAAKPNPTGAVGVGEGLKDLGIKPINIAGCPPNPMNFVGAVVAFLKGDKIELDAQGRPKIFFGQTVHELCPRLPMFEAGKFAKSFGSEEAKKGYCLYELGCKGPNTYNNCPKALFNQVSFPIQAGHPCFACSEPGFWDLGPIYEM